MSSQLKRMRNCVVVQYNVFNRVISEHFSQFGVKIILRLLRKTDRNITSRNLNYRIAFIVYFSYEKKF